MEKKLNQTVENGIISGYFLYDKILYSNDFKVKDILNGLYQLTEYSDGIPVYELGTLEQQTTAKIRGSVIKPINNYTSIKPFRPSPLHQKVIDELIKTDNVRFTLQMLTNRNNSLVGYILDSVKDNGEEIYIMCEFTLDDILNGIYKITTNNIVPTLELIK